MGCFYFSFFFFLKWHFLHQALSSKLVLKHLLFLCLFSISLIDVVLCDSDKSVLLQFKESVSDPSGLLSSWSSVNPDHCSWFGISCDSNSRVVSLNISGSGNRGNSSAFSCSDFTKFPLYGLDIRRACGGNGGILVGKLPPILGSLRELRILSLPFNGFEGEVPDQVWGLENLEVLDLEDNLITGLLPKHLTVLKNLRVLNLAFNKIEGDLPSYMGYSLHLEVLNLAGNQLNGTIPGLVGRMKAVYLSFNLLTGSIPIELGDSCGKLEHLDLSSNYLVHRIPSSLGNCSNLRTLLLYSNMLEESIPSEIGQLKKLEVVDVSRNSLSGAIPHELGNCVELSVLVLSNPFDPLPQIKNTEGNYPLEEVSNDDFNFFQGAMPTEIAMLPKMRILWAPRASLEGNFPSNWGSCKNLQMVSLAQNFLSGELPQSLSRCKKLQFLDLSSNKLSGELDEELSVPCMTLFDISENHLSGPIPRFVNSSCLSFTAFNEHASEFDSPSNVYVSFFETKIWEAVDFHFVKHDDFVVFHNFGQNNFTGGFQSMPIAPERLGTRTAYAYLAGENKLTGPFPGNLFENCLGLGSFIVNVSYNRISGQIPSHIGQMCSSLKYLDASGNQISGPISTSFGDMVSLDELNLSRNMLEGRIPPSLGQLTYLRYLSLANNRLNGSIPSSLGQLQALKTLDLSSNSLVGVIPNDLVNLRNLTVLLLTNNNLSGQIPSDLANVTTLSVFNVSFNNLSGSLPLDNFIKCNSALGNPQVVSCSVSNLMVSSSTTQGSDGNDASNYAASPPGTGTQTSGGNGFNSIEIASITSASAIVSVLLALIVLFFYTRKWNPKSKVIAVTRKEVTVFNDIGVPLNFDSVVRATGNFSAGNCIGNGGFGATYKAEISAGVLVAIKRLSVGRFQGVQQFHAEIKTLGRLRHPNLVTLIGYHACETEMFLIYNYLPGGNLEKFIHERSTRAVFWRILHKIALDIARALAYLHDQCVPRVLHRDVKPSNILLDDDLNAYLSDFGLARLLGTSETHATTGVAGTFGYVAPEYAMTCRVSDKADVYSYGVVLLELLSDKKALDPSFSPYGNGFNIVAWACMLLRQGRAKEFFTAGLWDVGPHDDLVEVLHLAVVCTVDSLSTRPTMKQVVRRLKQLQPPSC